jgi:hypothetical protein
MAGTILGFNGYGQKLRMPIRPLGIISKDLRWPENRGSIACGTIFDSLPSFFFIEVFLILFEVYFKIIFSRIIIPWVIVSEP